MTGSDNNPALERNSISGAADLLASIPALLGFHPRDSLVLVGLEGSRLVVTARTDLDETSEALLSDTLRSMTAAGVDRIVAAVYTNHSVPNGQSTQLEDVATGFDPLHSQVTGLPHRDVVARVHRVAATIGIDVLDYLLTNGERWWSCASSSSSDTHSAGRALPQAPTAAHAGAIYNGVHIATDRAELAERFTPDGDRERLRPLMNRAEHRRAAAAAAGRLASHDRGLIRAVFAASRAHPDQLQPIPDPELARLAVALSTVAVRDAAWLAVDDARLPDSGLWVELARRLPAPDNAPALFLAGWRAWRDGNGALASIAAQSALEADPEYSAATLLLSTLAGGIDPRSFPTLRSPRFTCS